MERRVLLAGVDFSAGRAFAVGGSPVGVAAGDFNGDGKMDLVTVSKSAASVSVLLGTGDGRFQPKLDYGVGAGARSVAVGDLNGDGKLDLVTVDYQTSDGTDNCFGNTYSFGVSILMGNGDGTFQPAKDVGIDAGAANLYRYSVRGFFVEVGDTNGDGKNDIVATYGEVNTYETQTGSATGATRWVEVLLNDGDGTFQVDPNGASWTPTATTGDFNGDGNQDVATAYFWYFAGAYEEPPYYCSGLTVLLGNGDGTYSSSDISLGNDYPTTAVATTVGDYNGDGNADVVVSYSDGNRVSILLGNGDGTFQAKRDLSLDVGYVPESVVSADIDGDGKSDLVTVSTGDSSVGVFLGEASGSIADKQDYPVPGGASSYPPSLASGDFNGDGKTDLATASSGSDTVSVLLGNGDGTFQPAANFPVGDSPSFVTTGDFNSDGKLDLAVANRNGNSVSILLGTGDGKFAAAVSLPVGTQPVSIAVGDLNGDKIPDLAVANFYDSLQNGSISVLLGKGDGTFQPAATTALPFLMHPNYLVAADLNGDGDVDLAIAGSRVIVWMGQGDGTFQSGGSYGGGQDNVFITTGDVNGDGAADLVTANSLDNPYTASVTVLLGKGDGTFQAQTAVNVGQSPRSVAIGDFNGDGRQDLAVASKDSNAVSVLLGRGDGTFPMARGFLVGYGAGSVLSGDFNGDGKKDLAVARYGSTVSVLLNLTIPAADHAPTDLLLSSDTIAEDQAPGTVVGTFSTIDPDVDEAFIYALVAGDGGSGNNSFVIVGDQLRTVDSLDFALNASYSIRVRSTDIAGKSLEKVLTINVLATPPAAWVIDGTSWNDTISLTRAGTQYQLNWNGSVTTKPVDAVSSITINGLDGDDSIMLDASVLMGAVISGGAGRDTLTGGAGADVISGDGGADVISGGSGNDTLAGGGGGDVISGNGGVDLILGGGGADTMYGNSGNDTILGATGSDLLYGQAGNDSLNGGAGNDTIYGAAGADTIVGGPGNDLAYSGGGNDTVYVNEGAASSFRDSVFTGLGTDQVAHDPADSIVGTYVDLLV